jgi:hypothetical protein
LSIGGSVYTNATTCPDIEESTNLFRVPLWGKHQIAVCHKSHLMPSGGDSVTEIRSQYHFLCMLFISSRFAMQALAPRSDFFFLL